MSTALMQLTSTGAELSELDALILAEMDEETTAFDIQLPRVKIAPGGTGFFALGDEMVRSFSAIVAVSQKVRGYWPQKETGSAPPMCSSNDSLTGVLNTKISDAEFKMASKAHWPHPAIPLMGKKNAEMPASWDCSTCPLAQWGSAHQNGQAAGQACKSMVRLLLLIDGWALPAIMNLPPTSVKVWGAYGSALRARKLAYFAVKTKFELSTTKSGAGIAYDQVKVSQGGDLSLDEVRLVTAIRHEFGENVRSAPVEAQEYETGEYVESTATAATAESQPADDIPF